MPRACGKRDKRCWLSELEPQAKSKQSSSLLRIVALDPALPAPLGNACTHLPSAAPPSEELPS